MNDRGVSKGAMRAKSAKNREIIETISRLARSRRLPQGAAYCIVQLHYLPKDNRRRDTDNLVATLKPICDGLAGGTSKLPGYGLVPDDIPAYMAKPEPIIHRHERGEKPAMWIELTYWMEHP